MKLSKHTPKNVISLDRERKKRGEPPPRIIPFLEKKGKLLNLKKESEKLRKREQARKSSTRLPEVMMLDLDQFASDVSAQMRTLFSNQKHLDRKMRTAYHELRHLTRTLSDTGYSLCDLMIRVMNLETENETLTENLAALMRRHKKLRARYIRAKRKAQAQGIEW